MDYEKLTKKLKEAKAYFQPESEITVFSIGGKGYYENPVSDVLAFFLDPQEVHGFGTLFLDSLFDCLGLTNIYQSLDLVRTPKRELSTENGKRIDILLEGNEWVLVIENKIYHHQNNPFVDYEQLVRKDYDGKTGIFVILSPGGRSATEKWKALSYKTYIEDLKRNIGKVAIDAQYSKWFVFLRDFILNIEQYAVRYEMDSKAISFVEDNYQDIYEVFKLRESYINHVQKAALGRLKTLFPSQTFTTTIHNWGHGPAIRYYSESWIGQSNLVVQLSHRENDKGIGVYIYAYNIQASDVAITDGALLMDHHKKPWTESKSIRCYKSDRRYEHWNDLIPEFEETARKFNNFNKSRKT
jgi:PD-(D/E)XK nuclease superfamily protein